MTFLKAVQEVCPSPAGEPARLGLPDSPRRVAATTLALLGALWAAKTAHHALAGHGLGGRVAGEMILGLVVAGEVLWPTQRCERHQRSWAAVGLHHHAWAAHLRQAGWGLALALPLYGLGVWGWMAWSAPHAGGGLGAAAAWAQFAATTAHPVTTALGRVAGGLVEQVVGVALPEEVFFRGYLLPQLWRRWPVRRAWQAWCGPAACLTALAFAMAHWLGEWQPQRLLPALPALWFGQLAYRQQGLVGATAAHAGCNLGAQVCWAAWAMAG